MNKGGGHTIDSGFTAIPERKIPDEHLRTYKIHEGRTPGDSSALSYAQDIGIKAERNHLCKTVSTPPAPMLHTDCTEIT